MLALEPSKSAIAALAFSPDSSGLLVGALRDELGLFDELGQCVARFPAEAECSRHALGWSPSGSQIAFGDGPRFALIDLATNVRRSWELAPTGAEVTAVAYLSDDLLAVGTGSRTSAASGSVQLWDIPRALVRPQIFREEQGVRTLAAHPHTKSLAWIGGADLSVWPITRADRTKLSGRHSTVNGKYLSVAFSPDGGHFAAGIDWSFTVYHAETGRVVRTLRPHKGQVAAVAFSPDRRTLATGSWDETIRFWDFATGEELAVFRWGIGKISALAFSPDGSRLAAGSLSGEVVVWDMD